VTAGPALAAVALAAAAGACLPSRAPTRVRRLTGPPGGAPPQTSSRAACAPLPERLPWRRRAAARRRRAVLELCRGLAAELRAGGAPRSSLVEAARGLPDLAALAAVAGATHGDVPAALRAAARRPGAGGLVRLATAWQVCERSGSGLAFAVGRLAETLREDEQLRHRLDAELAGPRATATLLALLPLFGLAIGTGLGAGPVAWLHGSPVGWGCLCSGLLLESVGLAWTARIARAVEAP
jgi:tight adherence protein B